MNEGTQQGPSSLPEADVDATLVGVDGVRAAPSAAAPSVPERGEGERREISVDAHVKTIVIVR